MAVPDEIEFGQRVSVVEYVAAGFDLQVMQDPVVLARCIPGCDALEKIGENDYRMKMKMSMASLSGAFDGKVRITEQSPPDSFRLEVEGSGRIGFVKGGGLLKIVAKVPTMATCKWAGPSRRSDSG